ncbi:MAG TPA: MarR family winged helix-turn-helix transcriptional regulator [Actinomycetales bacterium]|nr:MarR family winged helix-turn-helix transcriptional regulator [Actinomycetales bacterium]
MSSLSRVADRPTWLLSRANARAQALLAEAFAQAGVRGYHFRVLAALEQHGPSSQAEISRLTGIDRSDVVATVNDLSEWGLVVRSRDDDDRRRNVITPTEAGMARLEDLDALLTRVQAAVLAPLTSRERTTLIRLLGKIA